MNKPTPTIIAFAAVAGLASVAFSAETIKTLIITGKNNHNWRYTSRAHQDALEATGRFSVTITDDPKTTLEDASELSKYQLLVLDYNDPDTRWGATAEKNFEKAVENGAGVVAIHAADNAFKGWANYEKMLGLMWRDGAGHGKFHEFTVDLVDTSHPITSNVVPGSSATRKWVSFTTTDELYHKLSNPQQAEYHLLAQAMSSKESGGTGAVEPMLFTLSYGKGRIVATPLGHVWEGSDSNKVSIANPWFKAIIARSGEWAATGKVTLPIEWKDVRTHNTLTDAEKKDGWTLLFDGTTPQFHTFGQTAFPDKGWKVEDGEIRLTSGGSGDIATNQEYGDFEFELEWKIGDGGNSGIMYRCTEDHKYPWETGPEMQILDDSKHADGKKPKTRAGTLYDLVPCSADVCRPPGEWNRAKISIKGTHYQHFLNGIKIVDVDTTSEEFKTAYKASKWPGMKDYNTKPKGHICLQDHGDPVAFRNIKVRELR